MGRVHEGCAYDEGVVLLLFSARILGWLNRRSGIILLVISRLVLVFILLQNPPFYTCAHNKPQLSNDPSQSATVSIRM